MSTAAWVIQENASYDNTLPLVNALRELNSPFFCGSVQHFTSEWVTPPELPHRNLVPYGSTSLINIALRNNWKHVFFNTHTFRTHIWNDWREDMLNQDSVVVKARDFKQFYGHQDAQWFVRPVDDFKAFVGFVETGLNFGPTDMYMLMPDLPIAVSEVKEVLMEWRWFVVDGKVISGSTYRFKGHPQLVEEHDPEVIEEAQRMANKWLPHPCCVMDLALTNEGLKVVEFNCLNASGLYRHNAKAIVRSVNEYVGI